MAGRGGDIGGGGPNQFDEVVVVVVVVELYSSSTGDWDGGGRGEAEGEGVLIVDKLTISWHKLNIGEVKETSIFFLSFFQFDFTLQTGWAK